MFDCYCRRRPVRAYLPVPPKVQVLVPKTLDITAIQKCPVDYNCEFISKEDKAASEKLKNIYVIYQENYFIANLDGYEVKCDYNCRNRVMTTLCHYRSFDQQKISSLLDKKFDLDFIDDVVHNNNPPLMIFSNEELFPTNYQRNSIMENYSSVDVQQLASNTQSKPCRQDFFLIYLGEKEVQIFCRSCNKSRKKKDARYMCCSMKTLETYEYSWELIRRVDQMLLGDVDECIAKLKAEDEVAKLQKPAKRMTNFRLTDIDGNLVEENVDYYLQLFTVPEDVLKIRSYSNSFYATYRLNRSEKIIVRYVVQDNIHYLTYKDQILQGVGNQDEFGFDEQVPEKKARLEFHVTENNAFKTVRWDDDIWLTFEKHTLCYSSITFNSSIESVRVPKPLELCLKKA
ncbi:hypothetical protein INT43_000991 [Umbelopsis isabellina]|uniref:Uncharacterized protein n=1 Tax=Mortierella isabellina TaxID=91625 RepID=A0A8H7UMC6_MORIS|nr:hypothetical protein INT43_000991 [Umbelopsis isabellina]